MYRIVKEQAIEPNKVSSVLNNLKKRYGMPDKQQIKTGSVRPRNRKAYTTTVKYKAIWNISETQEFIAEIESKRVVYELLDNDPMKRVSSNRGIPGPGSLLLTFRPCSGCTCVMALASADRSRIGDDHAPNNVPASLSVVLSVIVRITSLALLVDL